MRTTAGPSRVWQWVLTGGPYTTASQARQGPCGVPAAVAEASLMTDQHLAGAKPVAVRAVRRWVGDPLPGRGLYQFA